MKVSLIKENQQIIQNIKKRKTKIHIDSSFRNQIPKNILDNIHYLTNNPLFFIKDTSEIIIYDKNHKYQEEDRIVINNVQGQIFYLTNALIFNNEDEYITIYHPNNDILDLISSDLYSSIYIIISGVIGNQKNGSFYNNMQINLLNKKHQIYTKKPNGIYNSNYYYIKTQIIPNFTETYNNMITISFQNIKGIPINSINANYPISFDNMNGYHIINKVYNNNFYSININYFSNNSNYENIIYDIQNQIYDNFINLGNGSNNINIAKIIDFIEGFPFNNHYKINLNRDFYNVYKINFISSEIPNTEKTIRNYPVQKQNNIFQWQILDDGDQIYNIEITPGNYNLTSLSTEITDQIQKIQRINANLIDTVKSVDNYYSVTKYHRTIISMDQKTNIFTIQMYGEISVDNAVLIIETSLIQKYTKLQIIHPNHGLNVGDTIYLSGILSFQKIPATILNTNFQIKQIIDGSNYIIYLPNYSNSGSQTQATSGTNNLIRSPLYFRLLFNIPGTIGNILGYKNIGNINSITQYNYIIRNIDGYENILNYDTVGNIYKNTYDVNINLNGDNYILMTNPLFKNSITIGQVSNIFVKLLLIGPPNTVIYNSFIQISSELPTIQSLNELEFYFYDKNGYLYNFNNIDHSFTIEIYEKLE